MPPSAPSRITGIGASTPRPSISGLRTLSAIPATIKQHGKADRGEVPVVAAPPDVGDRRQGDDQRRHLSDTEHQNDERENAGPRDAGDQQAEADDDGLDEGDTNDALGDRADGRGRQLREFCAAPRAEEALEDRPVRGVPACRRP